jgi:hypothetical protein
MALWEPPGNPVRIDEFFVAASATLDRSQSLVLPEPSANISSARDVSADRSDAGATAELPSIARNRGTSAYKIVAHCSGERY